jgi:hypothetical protein
LVLTLTCGPAQFRDALTALGSGGAGASLRELRLFLKESDDACIDGVEMLPGSLPQLRFLQFSGCELSVNSARSLLLAPGGFFQKLELYAPGVAAHTLGTIADEVRAWVSSTADH